MKALSLETTKLLDKLYNLRGSDSVVLVEMDKQKEKNEKTLERTTKEKSDLQEKIANLETEHEELETQGEKLKEVLSGIDKNEFSTVLTSLNIDFDPEALMGKVNENLPKTIDKVSKEQKTAEDELIAVEDEMNNAITTIEELGLRKDAAIANQDKLNEYFDLALNGKINITRDSITSLLEQFNFSVEEQREAAKILMFPEDALYAYDEKLKAKNADVAGKSISDVMSEAKDAFDEEVVEEPKEDVKEEPIEVEEEFEEERPVLTDISTDIENDIFGSDETEETGKPVEEEFNPFLIEDNTTNEEPQIDLNIDDFVLDGNDTSEEKSESNENIEEYLNSLGFNYLDFSSQDLDDLKNNFDKEVMNQNVELIKEKNIDLDIFVDNSSLLYDKELKEKIEILLNLGKEPIDIYLNPSILIKYTAEKLNNAIELLKDNGMDPKNVPLMAY